jgi:phosphoribosylformylglycinamidine synthase
VLLGADPGGSLAGSRWAADVGKPRVGVLDPVDLAGVTKVAGLVRELVGDGVLSGVHDVAEGGLGRALAEMAVRSGVGVAVAGVDGPAALLCETPGRVVASVPIDEVAGVLARAADAGVPARELGAAGGDRLLVEGLVDVALADAVAAWRDRLPAALDAPVTQG